MAPPNTRKRKSEAMDEPTEAGAVTPTGSPGPARKKMRITPTQKQALMDNLQLEITERARQLRAGYALQCADLRSRIERRVNRIPLGLRKMTMGELMRQQQQQQQQQGRAQATAAGKDRPLPPLPPTQTSPNRQPRRKSPEIYIASDADDARPTVPETLPVAKNKRAKAAAAAPPTRTASRAATAAATTKSVLSPRSHNSRTLPRSPVKDCAMNNAPTSPSKHNHPLLSRPTSPLKPASPLKTAASAASSAISASVHGMIEHAKRGTASRLGRTASKEKAAPRGQMLPPPRPAAAAGPASPQRTVSQASSTHSTSTDVSTASSGTTVVKAKRTTTRTAAAKTKREPTKTDETKRGVAKAAGAARTALKRNATTTTTTTTTAAAANKKVVVAEPAAGRRVLRKRT